ncbi:hypothetical protein AYO44_05955 [Planctomycetaceae bacterium SCGC AG-212-F19]|nr:hypothetical protein AYO44_05955 [Planctomycetaceae bacterium SCGC AG-212-F19]
MKEGKMFSVMPHRRRYKLVYSRDMAFGGTAWHWATLLSLSFHDSTEENCEKFAPAAGDE